MNNNLYASMTTPAGRRAHVEMTEVSAVEEMQTASQIDRAFRLESNDDAEQRHRVQFNGVTMSDRSSRVSRSEMGRSLARVYDPTLQERAQHFLEGQSGLYLELVNLAFSCIIFAMYIVELYNPGLAGVSLKRIAEVVLTSFFIFDLGLHLFVAPNPLQYLFSMYGLIDVITIIPSFLMYFTTSTKSQTFFILRVLRIFRALRVLRLKRFIRFKRHGFNYELSVFLLSAVAVTLCAAGMYHAIEEAQYMEQGETFRFHQALYFVLVTMSTVGYGDISPQTTLGQLFVMLLIIAVFTIIPQKATKLNTLAKQNHPYDKDYTKRSSKRSGHVIVSGLDITVDSIWDFLDEFYHESRGNIHLDVVFMCEAPPSPAMLRFLARDRFAQKTKFLRGSLSNGNDQKRARLGEATAVFFLANKLVKRESAQQDARTVLHTLAVRNFADSSGISLDIYTQLRSHEQELEMTVQLLGSNTTNTSELQTMILSRSAVCPGASTLILNLLRSVSVSEYAKSNNYVKNWIEEYVDGMSYQVFPIIFTKRFQHERYDDVVKNIYEHYNAIVIMVRPRRRRRASNGVSPPDSEFRSAPFQTYIREGPWHRACKNSSSCPSYCEHVRILGGRRCKPQRFVTPRSKASSSIKGKPYEAPFSQISVTIGKSALFLLEQSRSYKSSEYESRDSVVDRDLAIGAHAKQPLSALSKLASFSNVSNLGKVDETSKASHTDTNRGPVSDMPIVFAARARSYEEVQRCLERDHFAHGPLDLEGHFIVCGGRLRDALSIVAFIRRFCASEANLLAASNKIPHLGVPLTFYESPTFVLLVEQYPAASDVVKVLTAKEEYGEEIGQVLYNVVFMCGSAARAGDLRKVAIDRACRVIMLPVQSTTAKLKLKSISSHKVSSSLDAQKLSHENLTDFGVINSLLVAEVVRDELSTGFSNRFSPRRRHSSRQHLHGQNTDGVESTLAFYRREVEQGLPLESIKVRMLDRFPDLEPKMFNQLPEVIATSLDRYDSDSSIVESNDSDTGVADLNQAVSSSRDDINTIALLHHASSAKFCRPRDPAVCHDEFPCLAPAFAGGDVLLSSVLDRIVCQAFYNPYVTDVVRVLACGDAGVLAKDMPESSRSKSFSSTPSRHLFQLVIDESYVGANFQTVFYEFLTAQMLVIGILRSPSPALENLRPFVYTCPAPDTTLHQHDRLFVLG